MDAIESHLILDEQVRFAALSTKKNLLERERQFPAVVKRGGEVPGGQVTPG